MNKSLGEYIRLIPREDQDTMVGALLSKRPGLHRGMLAFVPIEEIKQALRPRQPDYGYAQQQQIAAQQMAATQQQLATQQSTATQWYAYPTTTSGTTTTSNLTITGLTTGVGAPGYGLTPGGYGLAPSGYTTYSNNMYNSNTTQEVPQTYLFAYAALLAAINAMPGALDEPKHYEEEQKLEACEA